MVVKGKKKQFVDGGRAGEGRAEDPDWLEERR
jgi:hypothetical protein